ncbi:MAG: hypothetical protein ABI579_06915, partial [Candidatus Sumerlaeota bacterium]
KVGQDEANRAIEALRNLDTKQQEIVQQFTKQREREASAIRYMQDIRRSAMEGDFAKADGLLLEWRKDDPNNPSLGMARDWVEAQRKGNAAPGIAASTLQDLVDKAEKAEAAGNKQSAVDLWQQVRRTAVDDATTRRAAERINDLTTQMSKTFVTPQSSAGAGGLSSSMLMYIAIGVGVLILVGIIVLVVMKKKGGGSPQQPALSPMRAGMMTTPLPISGNSMLAAMQGVKRDSKSAPRFASQSGVQRLPARDKPTNPRPSGEISKPAAAELARYESMATPAPVSQQVSLPTGPPPREVAPAQPSVAESASAGNGAQPGMEPIMASSVDLGNLVIPEAAIDEEVGSAQVAASPETEAPAAEDEDMGSARTVRMSDTVMTKPTPAATPAPPVPPSAPAPIRKAVQIPISPSISAATPPPIPTAANTYFEQKFDDEENGTLPRGWKGGYDYATLTVVDREGGGKCMKFEKGKGTGSAYFSCRFPDAAGRVVVEFDLRCDHKNKYLLGFYVEMDEDFRHSVHTVVHMDATKADKVSLRLQNETAPYKLGEWSRMRYLIDLPRNMVDGFVDDKPVAVGVRLPSRPRVVNTLSIRDNLATEGILMIDNIRIFKDRG